MRIDPGQIEQVLLNLVINARDAMPRGGRLTIEVATHDLAQPRVDGQVIVPPGRYESLTVSDTGIGMDAQILTYIFEPFFTTKGPTKGTGLGLSTVYGIISQSGGHVAVTSRPGAGATFRVYLPTVDDGVGPEAAPAPEPAMRTEPARVLIVEDEGAVRKLMRAYLAGAGYEVLEAAGPRDAIDIARTHHATLHLIVTDVIMPDMNGGELVARLRALHPESRVLYVSGYTTDAVAVEEVTREGKLFLAKPFSRESFLRKVQEILAKRTNE